MIYITGDTHGEMDRFHSKEMKKVGKGDTLLICGDFGFIWDGSAAERKSIRKLGSRRYAVGFVDGTHENFDLLATYPVVEWHGGKAAISAETCISCSAGRFIPSKEKPFSRSAEATAGKNRSAWRLENGGRAKCRMLRRYAPDGKISRLPDLLSTIS